MSASRKMENKRRKAEGVEEQCELTIELTEGDEVVFERSGDRDIRGTVVEVTADGMEYYGDFVSKYIFIEGDDGDKYVLQPSGMEANEPNAALYRMAEDWPEKADGQWSTPDTRGGDDDYLSYDVLAVVES